MHLGKMLTIFLLFIDPSYHKRGSKFDIACGTLKDAVHYFKRYYQKFNIDGFGGAARAEGDFNQYDSVVENINFLRIESCYSNVFTITMVWACTG